MRGEVIKEGNIGNACEHTPFLLVVYSTKELSKVIAIAHMVPHQLSKYLYPGDREGSVRGGDRSHLAQQMND